MGCMCCDSSRLKEPDVYFAPTQISDIYQYVKNLIKSSTEQLPSLVHQEITKQLSEDINKIIADEFSNKIDDIKYEIGQLVNEQIENKVIPLIAKTVVTIIATDYSGEDSVNPLTPGDKMLDAKIDDIADAIKNMWIKLGGTINNRS